MKIAMKLALGLGCLLLLLILMGVGALLLNMQMQRDVADLRLHNRQMTQCKTCVAIGGDLYAIAADAIINEDLKETKEEWKKTWDKATKSMVALEQLLDRESKEDYALLSTGKSHLESLEKLITTEKTGLFAVLEATGKNRDMAVIRNIDGQIDTDRDGLNTSLESLAAKIQSGLDLARKDYESAAETNTLGISIGLAVGCLLAVFIAWLLIRSLVKPITASTHLLEAIATQGDLNQTVDPALLRRSDEMGDLARSLESLMAFQRAEIVLAQRLADGDWSSSSTVRSPQDTLGHALSTMVQKVNSALSLVKNTVESMQSNVQEISAASESLSQGATEQAASLEEISSTMSEIGSQVQHGAEVAQSASALSQAARQASDEGAAEIGQLDTAMKEISKASTEIGKIIKVIEEIAFQTNLLALNAAVEAARAGRHGKGFAVVAEEVRSLAGRSAKAVGEVSKLVEEAVNKTANGAKVATRTQSAFARINEGVVKVNDLVGEIAAAAKEQTIAVSQVAQALSQVDSVTQTTAANAEETSSAAQILAGQSRELSTTVGAFTLQGGGTFVHRPTLQRSAPSLTKAPSHPAITMAKPSQSAPPARSSQAAIPQAKSTQTKPVEPAKRTSFQMPAARPQTQSGIVVAPAMDPAVEEPPQAPGKKKPKIVLDDSEFGKY
jgi:methyl-accepting chemotaxis protein